MNFQFVTLSACPSCDSSRLKKIATPGRWIGRDLFGPLEGSLGLNQCRSRGLTFTNPRPSSDLLTCFYSGDTYVCHDASAEDSGRDSPYLLGLLGTPTGRLLDFGCGAGAFLESARESGWDAEGYEPGVRGRETCVARGLPVEGDLASLPNGAFSVITAVHVFEHLPDPIEGLASFARLLAPGGRLILVVPNAKSLRARISCLSTRYDERYRAFPIHLCYYSPWSLRKLLVGCGWQPDQISTVGVGLEELVARAPTVPKPNTVPPASKPLVRRGPFRRLLRSAYFGSGLGENVVDVARPPGQPR